MALGRRALDHWEVVAVVILSQVVAASFHHFIQHHRAMVSDNIQCLLKV
jgi:hypothetical protein